MLASAGSGKTRVLAGRIVTLIEAHGVAPEQILAITFSKDAQENMARRLEELRQGITRCVKVRTFHAFGLELIREFDPENCLPLWSAEEKKRAIEKVLLKKMGAEKPLGLEVSEAIRYIELRKNAGMPPEQESADWREKTYRFYEAQKRLSRRMDFEDMLLRAYRLLAEREEVRALCRSRFRFILADEMQDTNLVQYELLRLIGGNLFFVSDPLQAIYGFRGGSNRYVLDCEQDFRVVDTLHLSTNYRSSREIVAAANRFARYIPESNGAHYVESIAARGAVAPVEYHTYDSDAEEAAEIAKKIARLRGDGYSYGDVAILTRTNAQLQVYETTLFRENIPYLNSNGISFTGRKEIGAILSYLRLARNPADDGACARIYNVPGRYLSRAFLEEAKSVAGARGLTLLDAMRCTVPRYQRSKRGVEDLARFVEQLSEKRCGNVGELIHWLRKALDLDAFFADEGGEADDSRHENMDAMEQHARMYSDLGVYLDFMRRLMTANRKGADAVHLMTIHRAKGLEFPVVFVPGVNDGVLPHKWAEDIDEEKRLMYVAMTRAESILSISSTATYMGREVGESEFIKEIFTGKSLQSNIVVRRGDTIKEMTNLCGIMGQKEKM